MRQAIVLPFEKRDKLLFMSGEKSVDTEDALVRSMKATLAYFDIFGYPLTAGEWYRWLWQYSDKISYIDFVLRLAHEAKRGWFATKDGLYFFVGQEKIVARRDAGMCNGEKKMRLARRAGSWLRYVPFVRGLFVCNSVAAGVSRDTSDIDLFVVIEDHRLFLARFFITGLLFVTGQRPRKTSAANKICVSFLVTTSHLDLAPLLDQQPDIYFVFWLDQLVPLYDPEGLHARLLSANAWLSTWLPHRGMTPAFLSTSTVSDSRFSRWVKKIGERWWAGRYGDMLESQAKAIQMQRIRLLYHDFLRTPSTQVVISDRVLKFHNHDRRAEYRSAWLARLGAIHPQ